MQVEEKQNNISTIDQDTGLPVEELRGMLTAANNSPASKLDLDEIKRLGRQMRDKHLANQK